MTTAAAPGSTAPRSGTPERGAAPRPAGPGHVVAWLVAALAVTASLGALVLLAAGDVWHLAPAPQVLVDAAVGISGPAMATTILLGRRTGRGTQALAVVLLVAGTASAATALTTVVALTAGGTGPGVTALVQLQSWLWVPGFLPMLTLVPLLYPDGLLPGRPWRAVAAASVVGTALLTVGVALHPDSFEGTTTVAKPLTHEGLSVVLAPLGALLLMPASLAAMASLALRFRRSRGLRRRQVVVLFGAAAVLVLVTVLQGLLPSPLDVVLQAGAVALLPVAIGIAVTRHRLYELDTAVCRAIVAASLTVCLAGLYLSVFQLVQAAGARSALSAAIAAGLTGSAIQPLARRLSAGVDRLFYGDRADPYVVTTRISTRLAGSGLDIGDVPQAVCDEVVGSLRLGGAEIVAVIDGTERRLAATGTTAAGERFPMRHRGGTAGWLVVTPRPGERAVTSRDREILAGLADLVAPSIAAVRLHQELQRSRELLVSAREAERLRLRRELHDGLGATLAGLRLQLESAEALASDPATNRLLSAASGTVQQAAAEVRTISEALRPPGIDDLGLARSIELLAERVRTPGLTVEVHAEDLGEVGPAAEVAAYRIAGEALANAARHAHASRIQLSLATTTDALRLSVTDDGVGVGAGVGQGNPTGSGIGLPSMRRRAEEIGGRFQIGVPTAGSGTELRVELPRLLASGAAS